MYSITKPIPMTEHHLYLTLPPYLAQWYAHECRRHLRAADDTCTVPIYNFKDAVAPIRGTVESGILELFLTKEPDGPKQDFKTGSNLVIAIPSFRNRDPRVYSYLRPSARELLYEAMRTRFQVSLWRGIHSIDTEFTRKDMAIMAWMEHNGIEVTDTNYNSVLKVYDRTKDAYRKADMRKAKKNQKK